ncbi:hypothetical protein ACO0LC_09850 [Undibacterium sp. JH2W]|uniref:hypothetical protein n=1 Tax=Undibacterium sp. JH2W TaxID=3413037 RepID=UPI003BF1227B
MTAKTSGRFSSPTRLDGETTIIGATAKQWDEALTGDMKNSLDIIKEKVQALKHEDVTTQIAMQQMSSGDLASAIKHRKTPTAA